MSEFVGLLAVAVGGVLVGCAIGVVVQLHRHRWETVGVQYLRPKLDGPTEGSAYNVERMVFGVTFVSLRCTECGEVSSREFLGRWSEAG